jgi:hypothetical protein
MVKPIHDSSYFIHFSLTNPLNHFNLYYDHIYALGERPCVATEVKKNCMKYISGTTNIIMICKIRVVNIINITGMSFVERPPIKKSLMHPSIETLTGLVMAIRHKIGMTLTIYINKNIKISMIEEIGKEDLWAYLSFITSVLSVSNIMTH